MKYLNKMEKKTDQIWKTEVSEWKHRNHQRELFLSEVLNLQGDVLEIGPGYGRVLDKAKNKMNIIGLELSENLTNILKSKGLKVIQGNALEMPFKDSSFDAVVCEEVIEHVKEQDVFLKEIFRVVKREGLVIIVTPNKWIYRALMYISNIKNGVFKLELLKNPTPGHVSELTSSGLKKLISQSFSIIKFLPINAYIKQSFLNKACFLSINNMVVARKMAQ